MRSLEFESGRLKTPGLMTVAAERSREKGLKLESVKPNFTFSLSSFTQPPSK